MKNTKIEVPAVAWWVLAALLIPVLQAWIGATFPGSAYAWGPLVVAGLGAALKWISWIMEQNEQTLPPDPDGDGTPFAASAVVDGEPPLDYAPPARHFDVVDFLFGVKRG